MYDLCITCIVPSKSFLKLKWSLQTIKYTSNNKIQVNLWIFIPLAWHYCTTLTEAQIAHTKWPEQSDVPLNKEICVESGATRLKAASLVWLINDLGAPSPQFEHQHYYVSQQQMEALHLSGQKSFIVLVLPHCLLLLIYRCLIILCKYSYLDKLFNFPNALYFFLLWTTENDHHFALVDLRSKQGH